MKSRGKKPVPTLTKLAFIVLPIIIGVGGVLLWYNYWPTYTNTINKISKRVVELQDRGNSALVTNDTPLMDQVAQDLLLEYKRLNDLNPDSGLEEYNTSVSEWVYLSYLGAEQSISLDLVAQVDEAVAKGEYEEIKRAIDSLRVQQARLDSLTLLQQVAVLKFFDYQSSIINWVLVTVEIGEEIVEKQLPPESGQIVWGEVPVFPALSDIPIDGGIFASLKPVYGPQPGRVFYNIPPNSSLWDSITSTTPTCNSIAYCYNVSPPDPPLFDEPPPFITLEDGSELKAQPDRLSVSPPNRQTVTDLPTGFPISLPLGTYRLSTQVCTSVTGCISAGGEETLRNADAADLARQISTALNQAASSYSKSCSAATTYTPFDSNSFTARQTITCKVGDQSVTSTIVIRIQKI